MRRKAWWWGTIAGLALCLIYGTARAAEKDTYQTARAAAAGGRSGKSWWPFGGSKKAEPEKKPAERARPSETKKPQAAGSAEAPPRPKATGEADSAALERAKLFRRLEAINRLRAIAYETNDPTLETEAQRLEQQAWSLCEQRTAQARLASLLPVDQPVTARKLVTNDVPRVERGSLERPVRSIVAQNPGQPVIPEE
jgi:hypothetical protein